MAAGRCACRSIHKALRSACKKDVRDIMLNTTDWDRFSRHAPAYFIRNRIGRNVWSSCYSFGVVRNPYHWFASRFWHGVRCGSQPDPNNGRMSIYDFERVMKSEKDRGNVIRGMTWLPYRTQYGFMADEHGRQLVTEIIKLENIAAAWPKLCAKLQIPFKPLPQFNVSRRSARGRASAMDYRDKECREFVYSHFRDDFERFGYSKDSV